MADVMRKILVFALLHHCSAEISNNAQGTWYSANVISDQTYSPRPLTDIFPTQSTFSPTNPIVVVSTTNQPLSSTNQPSQSNQFSFTTDSTTFQTNDPNGQNFQTTSQPNSGSSTNPPTIISMPQDPNNANPNQPNVLVFYQQAPQSFQNLNADNQILLQQQQQQPQQIALAQVAQPPQTTPLPCATSTPSTVIIAASSPTPDPTLNTPNPTLPPFFGPNPNFPNGQFPNFPNGLPANLPNGLPANLPNGLPANLPNGLPGNLPNGFPNNFGPVNGQIPNLPSFNGPNPNFQVPAGQNPFPNANLPNQQFPQVNGQNIAFPGQNPTIIVGQANPNVPIGGQNANIPGTGAVPTNATQNTTAPFPNIRIRMLSPTGSITNVNIQATGTTIRPRTTTRRNRRNTLDSCINSCGGRRTPICAAPLAVRPINPDDLKGFPSDCHLACNNSFRRNLFEKVLDGRCGRLRTRIRTIDAADRLRRPELNRNQYTIVQNPGTIIEFTPLNQ